MRISDWSSDVCSSDLPLCRFGYYLRDRTEAAAPGRACRIEGRSEGTDGRGGVKRTIYSEIGLQNAFGEMRQAFRENQYMRISFSTEKDRTLSQNAISHAWYAQIAAELRESTEYGVKCECKLRYGVPILQIGRAHV